MVQLDVESFFLFPCVGASSALRDLSRYGVLPVGSRNANDQANERETRMEKSDRAD